MDKSDYQRLYETSRALQQQRLDLNAVMQTLLTRAGQAVGVRNGCLITFNASETVDRVFILGARDKPENRDREPFYTLQKNGLVGYVQNSHHSVVIRNIGTDPRWPPLPTLDFLPDAGSAVGLPLARNGQMFGVLVYVHPLLDYFVERRMTLLQEMAVIGSEAIANAQIATEKGQTDTRYQAVFEHTPVPVVLTDKNGVIEDANFEACDFLGFNRGVLRGIPLQDVNIVPVDKARELAVNEESYFRTISYDIDGQEIPTLVRARHIQLQGRSLIEWILQDVSVQMELEQLRRDLSAMVYHDLRGPLGSIHTAVLKLGEVLQKHDNPLVLKLLRLALRSSQQVSRLVESLLDIQRLEDGDAILNLQPTEMHLLLTDALQLVLPNAEEAGISVDLDIAAIPIASIDADMITRVVINLMENGIKYTPDGGQVVLSAQQRDDHLVIEISDTGPGIPPDMKDRIFDKFSRVKYKNAPKGIGLGLAFCRLAVMAHGGRIWVESDGKNGSQFIFTLPLGTDGDDDASATQDNSQSYATTA